MTTAKSASRGVRRAGGGGKRLSREELDDLLACFRGETASAWCLLLPGYERCREDIRAHWAAWKTEHPGAPMPDGLASLLGNE